MASEGRAWSSYSLLWTAFRIVRTNSITQQYQRHAILSELHYRPDWFFLILLSTACLQLWTRYAVSPWVIPHQRLLQISRFSVSGFQGSLRRACSSFRLYNEQLSCCLLVLDHLYCTNTSVDLHWYSQLATALGTDKASYSIGCHYDMGQIHLPTSRCSLTSLWCPNIFMSRRNATFWSEVGEMGVGEQGPIH